MENLLEKWWGKNIVSIGRKSLNLANLRKRNKAKQQKLEGSQSLTTSVLETQELQQESEPPLPPPTPLEINRPELQESGEPNSELASKVERIFFVINILAELLSAGFDNLSSLNKHRYALIAMIMSYAAAIVSIIELTYEARKERVVWRWESMLPWFYHSSSLNYRPFSTVPEMTGFVFAILQTISSTVAYVMYLQHVNYSFNVSLLPLVLALAIFYSRFMKKPNPEILSERLDNIELNQVHVQVP